MTFRREWSDVRRRSSEIKGHLVEDLEKYDRPRLGEYCFMYLRTLYAA